jgi:transposase
MHPGNIAWKYKTLARYLGEHGLRLWAATEARSLGRGGVSCVARATHLSRTTIHVGLKELAVPSRKSLRVADGSRAPGGGRKRLVIKDPQLLSALEKLVEPSTRGDPMSALRWTCKSTTKLAAELARQGHPVSQRTVCDLLAQLGYSLQSVRKRREGAQHPDRDAQFQHIAQVVREFQVAGQPVISVDAKKKELIGDFANRGREWQPKGQPEEGRVYDFIDLELGKVTPYGVFDQTANQGWVSVGIDHDTAEFAVESIQCWWREMGQSRYPRAERLLITADCGGSNGNRVRLWKVQLQRLANSLGLTIRVCHLPPGTSKWNKIEHRLFCHITNNWRGRPLVSRQVVVDLIGQTTTAKGLRVKARLDPGHYQAGIKVSDEELAKVRMERDAFHGEWNYTIQPETKS